MIEQLHSHDIHVDYLDLNSMRLMWNTTDHCFFCNYLSFLICPELREIPKDRFVPFKVPGEISYYVSVLKKPSRDVARFLEWFLSEKNTIASEYIRLTGWLEGEGDTGGKEEEAIESEPADNI